VQLESSTKLASLGFGRAGVTVESKPAMAESRRDTFAVDARVSLAATVPLDESFRSLFGKGSMRFRRLDTTASKWLAREYGEVFEESIKFGYFVRFGEEKALADVHFVGLEAPPLFGFLNAEAMI